MPNNCINRSAQREFRMVTRNVRRAPGYAKRYAAVRGNSYWLQFGQCGYNSAVQIRYHFDPSTGLPHIYQHNVAENEVEDILRKPSQDIKGRDDSRIAIGQTSAGRYLRVIYVADPVPDSVFVITAYELGPNAKRAIRRRKRKKR